MHIIGCQLDIVWEDREANFRRVEALLSSTTVPPDSLIILPEMFPCGFTMDAEKVSEGDPSPSESFVTELAQRHKAWVMAGIVKKGETLPGRNVAIIAGPDGKLRASYEKIQPFAPGGEAERYEAGSDVIVFPCNGFTVCPFICYDLRFPEIFRLGVQMGAELFVDIANWPAIRVDHWITLLRARAIENQAYVVGVNRCGNDPKIAYPGRSIVVDPQGEIIADAGIEETLLIADIDHEIVADWRKKFPALQDLRPKHFGK
jgi:predicted amidohydrolase